MEKRIIYIITCKNCPNNFEVKITPTNFILEKHKKFCCLSCANSFNKMGEKNPMFGKESWIKGKTKETDIIIKKMSDNKSGENHHYYKKKLSKEHKDKIKQGLNKNESFKIQAKRPIKQKFQEKYGDLWEEHYNNFLISMSKTNTLEWFIEKLGEIEGNKKYKERNENLKINSHFVTHPEDIITGAFSKISQELFWILYFHIKESYAKIYFAELNHEHSCETGPYRFDFVVLDNKKIIEFNGDKFHPKNLNEEELKNWKTPHGILGSTIFERDTVKKEKAEYNDFQLLYIWESEFKENRELTINKCLKFITS